MIQKEAYAEEKLAPMTLHPCEQREISRCLVHSDTFSEITTTKVVEIGKLFFDASRQEFEEMLIQENYLLFLDVNTFSRSVEYYFKALCTYAYEILRTIPTELREFIHEFELFVFDIWTESCSINEIQTRSS